MAIALQGVQIASVRRALGLGVPQFAAVLGVHASTVHRWEAAGSAPIMVDGVAANVLLSLIQRIASDRRARQQAARVGDEVANALVVAGALAALAVLIQWITTTGKR